MSYCSVRFCKPQIRWCVWRVSLCWISDFMTWQRFSYTLAMFRHKTHLVRVRKRSCFWLKIYGSVTTNSWKLSCHLVLLPRTRLKNVQTSCWKYPVVLTRRMTYVGLLKQSVPTFCSFTCRLSLWSSRVNLDVSSHSSSSSVLLGFFFLSSFATNENKYQQIILIRWLECERLTRNLLSLLCVVVVAAGENKWAFKSPFPEDTRYRSQKAACSHAAWTDVKYILLFSITLGNVSFNTKYYVVEPFCEDRMITLSEKVYLQTSQD